MKPLLGQVSSDNQRLILHSRLAPIALAEKMRTLIGEGDEANPVGGVWGRGNEREMTLFSAQRSSPLEFTATLEEHADGTRIDGRFVGQPLLTYIKWMFLGVGSIFIAAGIWLLFTGAPLFLGAMFIGLPLFQWAILFTILHLFNRGKKADRAAILAFMEEHMELVSLP